MPEIARLDQDFRWNNVKIQGELQRLMGVLESRIRAVESLRLDWQEQIDQVAAVGLTRVSETLGPLLQQLKDAADLGFLVAAASGQPNQMVMDEPFGIIITSDGKELFTPTPWLTIQDISDPNNWGIGELQLYNPSTGELTVTIKYVVGGVEGSNWVVACSNAVLPIMQTILLDAQEAQASAENAVTVVNETIVQLEALRAAIASGPVSRVANKTGDVVLFPTDIVGLTQALAAKAESNYVTTAIASKQDVSVKLTALANLNWAANQVFGLTGAATVGAYPISNYTRDTLFGLTDANAWKTALAITTTIATDADIRAGTGGNPIAAGSLTTASAFVTLTDAATIALAWTSGINFQVTIAANRTLGNPTGGIPGTTRTLLIKGSSATVRTLSWGTQYINAPAVIGTLTDVSITRWYDITIKCITATQFVISVNVAL